MTTKAGGKSFRVTIETSAATDYFNKELLYAVSHPDVHKLG